VLASHLCFLPQLQDVCMNTFKTQISFIEMIKCRILRLCEDRAV
jgi:hypothetical protein